MTDEPTPAPRARPPLLAVLFNYVLYILMIAVISAALFLVWPGLVAQFQQRFLGASAPAILIATAAVGNPSTSSGGTGGEQATPVYRLPTALPIQNPGGSYNSQAAADAAYATAVAGAEGSQPVPNQDNLPADAPLPSFGSRVNDRQPAGENVPTAEPIPQTQSNDAFGTKRTAPINIQETHQCLHGAVWTDSGCHYPTPVQ